MPLRNGGWPPGNGCLMSTIHGIELKGLSSLFALSETLELLPRYERIRRVKTGVNPAPYLGSHDESTVCRFVSR
jgi:hypothetical protein